MCELSFLKGKKGEISAYLLAFNADALKVSTKTRSCPTNTLYLWRSVSRGGGGGGGFDGGRFSRENVSKTTVEKKREKAFYRTYVNTKYYKIILLKLFGRD